MGKYKKNQSVIPCFRASEKVLARLPRCTICGQLIVLTCDRTKPSKLVEWMGMGWLKTKPQMMNMYPTAEKQEMRCLLHKEGS